MLRQQLVPRVPGLGKVLGTTSSPKTQAHLPGPFTLYPLLYHPSPLPDSARPGRLMLTTAPLGPVPLPSVPRDGRGEVA